MIDGLVMAWRAISTGRAAPSVVAREEFTAPARGQFREFPKMAWVDECQSSREVSARAPNILSRSMSPSRSFLGMLVR
jgi:hypothetical protein